MKVIENYVDFKIFGCRDVIVYEKPTKNSNPIDKVFANDVFKADVSYVYWSTEDECFYKTVTPAGNEGYIRTDVIRQA